jgi:hypothetical protein
MKNFKPFFLLILLTGIFWAFRNPAPENKKALVIAIGHYKSGTGWDTLSSLNDERIIRDALTKQGFSRISSVLDEKATLDGIRTEMKNFIQSVKKGDIIYLHFSGHGQQVADNNGDKDEMDGLDECLVPWDAQMTAANGYKGEKHLRDDEFGQWVQVLRDKVGANGDVMVVLDACHSGTALRGDHRPIQRGNARALIPAGMDMTSFTPGREPGAVDNADIFNKIATDTKFNSQTKYWLYRALADKLELPSQTIKTGYTASDFVGATRADTDGIAGAKIGGKMSYKGRDLIVINKEPNKFGGKGSGTLLTLLDPKTGTEHQIGGYRYDGESSYYTTFPREW